MKIDRLLGIITILLQKDKVTAPYLAEKFEVSRRTITRDLDDISKSGIPIVTTQGGNGGISIMEGFKLDKNVMTINELQNIITGLQSINSVSNTPEIEQLLTKLTPNNNSLISLKDNIVIDLSSHYKTSLSEKISTIKNAINENKLIKFKYYYYKGDSDRTIEPYFISFKWSTWYVFGFCNLRQDFRTFKLNRILNLDVSDISFNPRKITNKYINTEIFYTEEYAIKIIFDNKVKFRLIEEYGPYCYTEKENGSLIFENKFANKDYMISWILGFGDKAQVIEPENIRLEIKEIVNNLLKKYNEQDI